jgi:hypothetical protein
VIQLDPLVEDALDRALPEPHERAPKRDDVLRWADMTHFARKGEGPYTRYPEGRRLARERVVRSGL